MCPQESCQGGRSDLHGGGQQGRGGGGGRQRRHIVKGTGNAAVWTTTTVIPVRQGGHVVAVKGSKAVEQCVSYPKSRPAALLPV